MAHLNEAKRKSPSERLGVSHPSDALLQEWIAQIQSGERGPEIDEISRRVLMDFTLRQSLGVPQSPITLDWLAQVIDDVLDHANARETLGLLPRPKQRPSDPERGMDVGCWIALAEIRGYSRADAVRAAADTFHLDVSSVLKMLKTEIEWINLRSDWESYFRDRRRPLPPAVAGDK